MKTIAVLADFHGNVPALEAVLDDLARRPVDEVLIGGDLVGRGPEGSRVAATLRDTGWRGVRGNHEDYLLAFRRGEVPPAWLDAEEWSATRWMAAELGRGEACYLDSLPFSLRARSAPELCLVHGSPRSYNEGLGPWSTDDELGEHLARVGTRLLVCAHTHRPMCRRVGGGLVVNVGAVGLPFNRDPRAQYAVLAEAGGEWAVEFRQVPYDVSRTLSIYESTGFLAHGGVTAELLKLELEHAVPFLVPFLKWAEVTGVPTECSRIGAFLDVYDPTLPLDVFWRRLRGFVSGA